MSTNDYWEKFARQLADEIADAAMVRMRGALEQVLRSEISVIFDDESAAAFLKTSKENLVEWAKAGLIAYAIYPVGRVREGQERGLGNHRTYSIDALLSFRERYLKHTTAGSRYELSPTLSLVGPAIEDKKMGRAA